MKRNEDGQTVLLTLMVLSMLLVGAGLGLGIVSNALVESAEAQTAADATALAGALSGRPGAEDAARANKATIVRFSTVGDDTLVTVEVGGARANARAHRGS